MLSALPTATWTKKPLSLNSMFIDQKENLRQIECINVPKKQNKVKSSSDDVVNSIESNCENLDALVASLQHLLSMPIDIKSSDLRMKFKKLEEYENQIIQDSYLLKSQTPKERVQFLFQRMISSNENGEVSEKTILRYKETLKNLSKIRKIMDSLTKISCFDGTLKLNDILEKDQTLAFQITYLVPSDISEVEIQTILFPLQLILNSQSQEKFVFELMKGFAIQSSHIKASFYTKLLSELQKSSFLKDTILKGILCLIKNLNATTRIELLPYFENFLVENSVNKNIMSTFTDIKTSVEALKMDAIITKYFCFDKVLNIQQCSRSSIKSLLKNLLFHCFGKRHSDPNVNRLTDYLNDSFTLNNYLHCLSVYEYCELSINSIMSACRCIKNFKSYFTVWLAWCIEQKMIDALQKVLDLRKATFEYSNSFQNHHLITYSERCSLFIIQTLSDIFETKSKKEFTQLFGQASLLNSKNLCLHSNFSERKKLLQEICLSHELDELCGFGKSLKIDVHEVILCYFQERQDITNEAKILSDLKLAVHLTEGMPQKVKSKLYLALSAQLTLTHLSSKEVLEAVKDLLCDTFLFSPSNCLANFIKMLKIVFISFEAIKHTDINDEVVFVNQQLEPHKPKWFYPENVSDRLSERLSKYKEFYVWKEKFNFIDDTRVFPILNSLFISSYRLTTKNAFKVETSSTYKMLKGILQMLQDNKCRTLALFISTICDYPMFSCLTNQIKDIMFSIKRQSISTKKENFEYGFETALLLTGNRSNSNSKHELMLKFDKILNLSSGTLKYLGLVNDILFLENNENKEIAVKTRIRCRFLSNNVLSRDLPRLSSNLLINGVCSNDEINILVQALARFKFNAKLVHEFMLAFEVEAMDLIPSFVKEIPKSNCQGLVINDSVVSKLFDLTDEKIILGFKTAIFQEIRCCNGKEYEKILSLSHFAQYILKEDNIIKIIIILQYLKSIIKKDERNIDFHSLFDIKSLLTNNYTPKELLIIASIEAQLEWKKEDLIEEYISFLLGSHAIEATYIENLQSVIDLCSNNIAIKLLIKLGTHTRIKKQQRLSFLQKCLEKLKHDINEDTKSTVSLEYWRLQGSVFVDSVVSENSDSETIFKRFQSITDIFFHILDNFFLERTSEVANFLKFNTLKDDKFLLKVLLTIVSQWLSAEDPTEPENEWNKRIDLNLIEKSAALINLILSMINDGDNTLRTLFKYCFKDSQNSYRSKLRAVEVIFRCFSKDDVESLVKERNNNKEFGILAKTIQYYMYMVYVEKLELGYDLMELMRCDKTGLVKRLWQDGRDCTLSIEFAIILILDFKIQNLKVIQGFRNIISTEEKDSFRIKFLNYSKIFSEKP